LDLSSSSAGPTAQSLPLPPAWSQTPNDLFPFFKNTLNEVDYILFAGLEEVCHVLLRHPDGFILKLRLATWSDHPRIGRSGFAKLFANKKMGYAIVA
jgi:hypothetical protein